MLVKNTLLLVLISIGFAAGAYVPPYIEVTRLSNQPIISSWSNNSEFLYNYNCAYMPTINDPHAVSLLVRVQNLRKGATTIYDVGPSLVALTHSIDPNHLEYTRITQSDIILDLSEEYQSLGVEDPRVVVAGDTYYVHYTALSSDTQGNWRAQLALATCQDFCFNKTNWVYHGPLFPNVFWSKSGSLLVHNDTHRYLFFNDSNIAIAQTKDLIHYDLTSAFLLTTRPDHFDSSLVEAGPEPLKLSDGNYLFLYNSARHTNISNPKPGWNLEYNLGWAILSGDDPTKVLARSEQPILSPELDWERCDNDNPQWAQRGLTPLVIFVEGWKQTGVDSFSVWYQGCDSTIGLAELKVHFA